MHETYRIHWIMRTREFMKKKPTLILIVPLIVVSTILIFVNHQTREKKTVTVQKIDGKGIFVGAPNMVPRAESKQEQITREVAYAWDNISAGENYFASGQYEQAVVAFKKAYAVEMGSQALSGFKLAETYEKLGSYDEAIALLDNMIAKRQLSALGVQDANEMKSRLLAASANKTSADPRQTAGGLASSGGKKRLDE